jgi:hypothetical protein
METRTRSDVSRAAAAMAAFARVMSLPTNTFRPSTTICGV